MFSGGWREVVVVEVIMAGDVAAIVVVVVGIVGGEIDGSDVGVKLG